MNEEQTVVRPFRRVSLVSLLSAMSQLGTLVVVAIALLYPAPFHQNQLPAIRIGSDLLMSHWPTALLIQRTFAQEHQLPLWNPYFGGGQPLSADPLATLFYPPTHLVHFLSLRDYYLVLILGHLVFAGLGMSLLARRALGLSPLPALVAAVSYMATPRLIGHLGAGHVTIVQTVAWFPWLALACWATVREPRRWSAQFGVCIALMLLAGHPQMAYYGLLMTAGLSAWLLLKRWRLEGWRAALLSLAGLAAAAGIGVLLAAVYLLPLMELTVRSTRQLSLSSVDTYPLQHFLYELIDQQPAPRFLWEGAPHYPWEGILTPGLTVLALALLALAVRWRQVWPLLLAIVIVAALAMGNSSPFYLLVAKVLPDFDRFRGLARIWFVALMLFALLAGLGTDALLQGMRRIRSRGTVAASFLLVLIVALSLVMTDGGHAHVGEVRPDTTPSLLARSAAQLAGSGRIYAVQGNFPQVNAVQLRTPLANGQDPLLIESYASYMQRAGGYTASGYQLIIPAYDNSQVQPHAMLLGLMHVSVVISQRPLTDPLLMRVGEVDGTLIYKNIADAGTAYLVLPGPDRNPPSLDQVRRLNADVRAITLKPEQETFTFSTGTAGYFVIAMPAFPGWNAVLDGHSAPVQLMAGVLPSIKVGPGTHTLSYTYAPPSVRLGTLLSTVGLLAVLGWLIAGYFWKPGKSRRSRKDDGPHMESISSADPPTCAVAAGEGSKRDSAR